MSHVTVLRLIEKHGLQAVMSDGKWWVWEDDLNDFVQYLKDQGATAKSIYGPRAKGKQGPWAHRKKRVPVPAKRKPVGPVVSAVYLSAMDKILEDADG